jgi:hypothetical protein
MAGGKIIRGIPEGRGWRGEVWREEEKQGDLYCDKESLLFRLRHASSREVLPFAPGYQVLQKKRKGPAKATRQISIISPFLSWE